MKAFSPLRVIAFTWATTLISSLRAFTLTDVSRRNQSTRHANTLPLSLGPELISGISSMEIVEMGIMAVASAAAGIISQQPRIQELEAELLETQQILNVTKEQLELKVKEFEDKIFVMDREYEAQTARFKKRYDDNMKKELERFKDKVVVDYKYKLEIELEQQKSKMLSSRLIQEGDRTDREAKLGQLRMEVQKMVDMNKKLEIALKDADEEMERMRDAAKKKSFLGLF